MSKTLSLGRNLILRSEAVGNTLLCGKRNKDGEARPLAVLYSLIHSNQQMILLVFNQDISRDTLSTCYVSGPCHLQGFWKEQTPSADTVLAYGQPEISPTPPPTYPPAPLPPTPVWSCLVALDYCGEQWPSHSDTGPGDRFCPSLACYKTLRHFISEAEECKS